MCARVLSPPPPTFGIVARPFTAAAARRWLGGGSAALIVSAADCKRGLYKSQCVANLCMLSLSRSFLHGTEKKNQIEGLLAREIEACTNGISFLLNKFTIYLGYCYKDFFLAPGLPCGSYLFWQCTIFWAAEVYVCSLESDLFQKLIVRGFFFFDPCLSLIST